MKRSMSILLGLFGLVILMGGCQHSYNEGGGTSGSSTSGAGMSGASSSPGSPAGSLQDCLDSIGNVSPGQRLLAETTCERNARVQAPMDQNPGDYLPPAK